MLSLVHVDHNYWHPIIAMSFSQDNSSEFSPIMPEEFGEHPISDQRSIIAIMNKLQPIFLSEISSIY